MANENIAAVTNDSLNSGSTSFCCCDISFNTMAVFMLHKYVKHAELDIWKKKSKQKGNGKIRGKYKKKTIKKEKILIIEDSVKPCPYCGIKIVSMRQHIKNIHTGEIIKCPKCKHTSRRKDDIERHYERVHTANTRAICGFCGKVYKNIKRHLQVSMCGRDFDDRERFTCGQCNVVVIGTIGLKKHERTVHENIKNLKCELCQYATYSRYNLRQHENKVHFKSPIKTEVCSICTIKTGNLEEHMETYHSE